MHRERGRGYEAHYNGLVMRSGTIATPGPGTITAPAKFPEIALKLAIGNCRGSGGPVYNGKANWRKVWMFHRVFLSVAIFLTVGGESLMAHDPHDPIVNVAVSRTSHKTQRSS